MQIIFHTIVKELTLLRRDPAALIILFLMPMLLVFIMTLVQSNVLGEGKVAVKTAVLGHCRDDLTTVFVDWLSLYGSFEVKLMDPENTTPEELEQLVLEGKYQFGIIIPPHLIPGIKEEVSKQVDTLLNEGPRKTSDTKPTFPSLKISFDPVTERRFQSSIEILLGEMMLLIEAEIKEQIVYQEIDQMMAQLADPFEEFTQPKDQTIELNLEKLKLRTPMIKLERVELVFPSVIQQNIPAWTLFGMFFIVLPLGGSLIRERMDGTFQRLVTLPAPLIQLLTGKLVAFLFICTIQYALMLIVGRFILPALGTSTFTITGSYGTAAFVAVSSGIAATGFGILMGSVAKSYDQLSMLGPVAIVLMAALGGIMVPVYVMPIPMQMLSQFSPMNWGLNAFLDIFVRGNGFSEIWVPSAKLIFFGIGCTGYSHYKNMSIYK